MSEEVKQEAAAEQAPAKKAPKAEAKAAPKEETKGRVEKIEHPSGDFIVTHN